MEVAAATGVSKEETGATAGKGCTICTAGGRTGWASYISVREQPGGRVCTADVKRPKKMGTISAHSNVIYGRQMGHMRSNAPCISGSEDGLAPAVRTDS